MAKAGAIAVNIITTFDAGDLQKAQKELDRLAKTVEQPGDALKNLGAKFQATGKSITNAGKTITATVGAMSAGLIAFGASSVKAAAEAESGQNRLRQILLTTGAASEKQVEALNKQAKALENLGVVSAGTVTIAQSQLATFDLQATTIKRLTPAILDYVTAEKGAAASADDFKQMTNGLAQALQGNFASLTKTGFVLDETTKNLIKNGTEAERSAALVDVLNSTYKGFNETLRGTTEGRLQVLRNSFDDLRTRIGTALLPVMETLLDFLQNKLAPMFDKLVTKFENLTDGQRNFVVGLVIFGAVIGPIIILVGSLTTAIGSLTIALGALQAAAAKARISLLALLGWAAIAITIGVAIFALRDKFEILDKAISYTGAFFKTFGDSVLLILLRIQHALLSVKKGIMEAFSFGFADTSGIDKQLRDIETRAKILSGTIDQTFANVRNKSILATEALRDQAWATRNAAVETKTAAELAAELAAQTAAQEEAARKAAEAAKKLADKLKSQAKAIKEVNDEFQKFAREAGATEDTLESLISKANVNLVKFEMTAGNTTIKVDRLIARLSNLGGVIQDQLSSALSIAKTRLAEAQSKYDSFAQTVKNSISSVLSFGRALEVSQDKEKKTTFLEALNDQAKAATTFADRIKKLVALGLSEPALKQVLDAGVEAGTVIADSIIEGGQTVVNQVNSLVSAIESVAKETGINAADSYYKTGVDLAKAVVQGILDQINAAAASIAAAIAAAAAGNKLPVQIPSTPGTVGVTGKAPTAQKIGLPLEQLQAELAAQIEENKRRAARLAAGGLGEKATAQLKEKLQIGRISADELRTDIRTFEPAGSTSSNVININVNAGIGTDGTQVGQAIVEQIKQYERIAGPVFMEAI